MRNWLFEGSWSGMPVVFITLILGLVLFTGSFVVSSRIDRKFTPHYIIGITVGVLLAIISMNLKTTSIVLNGHSFPLVLSSLFFPVLVFSTDVLNEFYGVKHAKALLYCSLITQLMMFILMFWFVEIPAVTYENHSDFIDVFALASRGFIASFVAMYVCHMVNIYGFHYLRKLTKGKMLWSRVAGTTSVSLFLDILIYTFILFVGTVDFLEMSHMMLISALVRLTFSFVKVPFMYFLSWLKKKNIFLVDEDAIEDSIKALQSNGG